MKKEDFILGDYGYQTEVYGISVTIQEDVMSEKTVAYANKILELYLSKNQEIIDYILNDRVLDFYGDVFTKDEIIEKLNEADIEIIDDNYGILAWLNNDIDEHIIEVEFNDDIQLSYVTING
jgi:hypothetical protein